MNSIAPAPSEYGKIRIFRKYIEIDKLLLYSSITLAITLVIVSIFLNVYKNESLFATVLILAFIISLIPYTIYKYLKGKVLERILDYYPIFLRDLADATLSGLSLIRALKIVSKSDYGPLTPFVKKLLIWIEWGVPFEKAFLKFNEYFKELPIIQRVNRIILESYKTGGDIAKVLLSVANNLEELRALDKERASYLNQQVAILYVIYFIFAVIIIIIINSFGPLVLTQSTMGQTNLRLISMGKVDLNFLKNISSAALIVEAVSIASVIGIAISSNKTALFRHLFILLTAAAMISIFVILPEKIHFTIYTTPTTTFRGGTFKVYGSFMIDGKPPAEPLVILVEFNGREYRAVTDENGYYEVTLKAPMKTGEYDVTSITYYKGKEYRVSTKIKVE